MSMYMYMSMYHPLCVWCGVGGVPYGVGWGCEHETRDHTHAHTHISIYIFCIYTHHLRKIYGLILVHLWFIHSLSHVDPGSSAGSINPLSGCRRSNIHKHPVEYGIAQIGVEIEQPLQILTVFHALQCAFSEVCKMVHVLDDFVESQSGSGIWVAILGLSALISLQSVNMQEKIWKSVWMCIKSVCKNANTPSHSTETYRSPSSPTINISPLLSILSPTEKSCTSHSHVGFCTRWGHQHVWRHPPGHRLNHCCPGHCLAVVYLSSPSHQWSVP